MKKLFPIGLTVVLILTLALSGCGGGSGNSNPGGGGTTTYSVIYNGNGGTGNVPSDNNHYQQGQSVTVLGNTGGLAKNDYTFAGWNTQADGKGTTYNVGQTFTMGTADVTLYARWVLFFDDFQRTTGAVGNGWIDLNGNAPNTNSADIVDEGGGSNILRIKINLNLANGDPSWTDYSFSAKFKVAATNPGVSLRFRIQDSQNFYTADLTGGTTVSVRKLVAGSWGPILKMGTVSYDTNNFHILKVVVNGNNIKIYFDNPTSPVIDYNDTAAPYLNGKIALFAEGSVGAGFFDDVLVTSP